MPLEMTDTSGVVVVVAEAAGAEKTGFKWAANGGVSASGEGEETMPRRLFPEVAGNARAGPPELRGGAGDLAISTWPPAHQEGSSKRTRVDNGKRSLPFQPRAEVLKIP